MHSAWFRPGTCSPVGGRKSALAAVPIFVFAKWKVNTVTSFCHLTIINLYGCLIKAEIGY
jgi:hypothetical protein